MSKKKEKQRWRWKLAYNELINSWKEFVNKMTENDSDSFNTEKMCINWVECHCLIVQRANRKQYKHVTCEMKQTLTSSEQQVTSVVAVTIDDNLKKKRKKKTICLGSN